ncbi:MAG: hypothetical protein AB2693_26355 [Candidatus Thiodiazotropha sp.]
MSAGSDRDFVEHTENASANFDDALDSESDTGSNGELNFESDENMKVILLDIRRNVKQINHKFDKMKKSVKDLQKSNSDLKKQNVELKQTVEDLKEQVGDLEKTVGQNTLKAERLEAHSRRNNLIIYGIPEDAGENYEKTEEKFRKYISDDLSMNEHGITTERVHRLYSRSKPSPIIVKFSFYKDRDAVLKKYREVRKSRETERTDSGNNDGITEQENDTSSNIIRIGEDFPVRVREIRRKLIPFLKAALTNEKQAFLKYDKLCVDGAWYSYSYETNQPVLETK